MGAYRINESACIGCTLCARNCPVRAISGTLKQPHRIDETVCVGCGACGRLCPRGAVLNDKGEQAKKVPKAEWSRPAVNGAACAGCSVCVENCPKGCLRITEPKERGDIRTVAALKDPEGCLGCGLCEKVCPIGAIQMVRPGEQPVFEDTAKQGGKHMLNRIWCRTFQTCMKLGNYFLGYRMPEYIEGPGSIAKLPEFMKEKGAKRPWWSPTGI